MDASTMSNPRVASWFASLSARVRCGRDRDPHVPAALLTVLVLPALVALCTLGWRVAAGPVTPRPSSIATRIVFITPRPPPVTAVEPTFDAPLSAPRPSEVRAARRPTAVAPRPPPDTAPPSTPPSAPLDYGNLLGAVSTPIAVGEALPWARPDAGREARPARFRMRRQVTPDDVVRGFAQLVGLWPPGYSDSPCPTLNRTIDDLAAATALRAGEQALLRDAVEARSRYC